ncbi:cytochrome c [Microbulbifer pacificus]|uniref:Cytochrome c n=1 Tax=Microbulbifer pacificus TaxID=407164 RepID=A0AAU0MXG0_9GAMM|nr:cytochrome c [Microbulbifer pacificus]WOX04693.1 cytochrome c [Microbulbifer pacificus]
MHKFFFTFLLLAIGGNAAAQADVEKGRYLAAAGDCVACHTATNGRPFIGGRPFHTPFGTLYSTNITPDKKTGIGNYTLEDFTAAMRRGEGAHGNLYPAMPYTSYYLIPDEDIASLYTYFMQLPAVEYSAPGNDLFFPANLRFGLKFWNWIFFDKASLSQPEGKSPEWQRGNYLVNGLGHCGECHTPRNFAFAVKSDEKLAGNILEGWDAVDIRSASLHRQGWDKEQLRLLFTTGASERGTAFGEMFSVVKHSLSHLSESDIDAIITYLLDDSAESSENVAGNVGNPQVAAEQHTQGRADFVAYCAGCHGREGRGVTLSFAPPMDRSAAVRGDSPYNTIAVILRGLPAQRMDRTNARAGMPSFHLELDDTRVAGLVNFMRTAWGGAEEPVTPQEVEKIRRQLREEDYLGAAE